MQRAALIILCSLMSLASSDIATQAVCLECWEALCNPEVPIPQECSCDCVIDPVNGQSCEEVAKLDFSDGSCCLEANEYINQEIHPSLTPVSCSSGQCSLVYNRSVNQNISTSVYSILPPDYVFVIDAIEFNCVGCIQSISLYLNQSTNVGDNTDFILSVWRSHTSALDNSTVFVSINSSQVNFDSQPVIWNNIYRADSTVHDALCFEPGDRLGLGIHTSFAGEILRPLTIYDGVIYMQSRSVCESLNDVLLKDSAQTSAVPLIDVTVIPSGSNILTPSLTMESPMTTTPSLTMESPTTPTPSLTMESPMTPPVSCDSMCIILSTTLGTTALLLITVGIVTLAVIVRCTRWFKKRGWVTPQRTVQSLMREKSTVRCKMYTLTVDLETLDSLSAKSVILTKKLILLQIVGQGEFGIVYKGDWFANKSGKPTTVAVKTLKGDYSQEEVKALLRESVKMKLFDHPNVMNLLGVCLDAGPAPYIVMPFMPGGDLLTHIKGKQKSLVLESGVDEEMITEVRKQLLLICLQIAKGMEYLSGHNFVHRDLAARNCMIDDKGVIKVADFGLSENVYEKQYFRQDRNDSPKLPIKWMALESMENAVFTEKSDVWSFGVTCWEIFSGGKQPYPGIPPLSLPRLLHDGHRLDRPINEACSEYIYSMLMLTCWRADPEMRSPFSVLVPTIESILTEVAQYLDLNEFVLIIDKNGKDKIDNETNI